jgi:hypothetical protein
MLVENREDTIYWCWTSDGEYMTKSAYNIQFQGAFSKLKNYADLESKGRIKM